MNSLPAFSMAMPQSEGFRQCPESAAIPHRDPHLRHVPIREDREILITLLGLCQFFLSSIGLAAKSPCPSNPLACTSLSLQHMARCSRTGLNPLSS